MVRIREVLINGLCCVKVQELLHFDMNQIMDSGQCFRIQELPVVDSEVVMSHSVCHGEDHVRVDTRNTPGEFIFHCNLDDFNDIWYWYFNLDTDYYEKVKQVLQTRPDPFLEKALEYGSGIRILRQGLFEALLAFVISQNNNIKRITKSLNAMYERYGDIKDDRGITYYSIPSYSQLLDKGFTGFGLGYREKYFQEMFSLNNMQTFISRYIWLGRVYGDYSEEKRTLMEFNGIGSKVADCICLYGLHQMKAYPIDTWMKKIIDQIYNGYFDTTPYTECAGYVQQLQFYYYRSLGGGKRG